jgi:ribonuclease HI
MIDGSIVMILAAYTSIILMFDGSLRSPSDCGVSFMLHRRSGACAACIIIEGNDKNNKNSTINTQYTKNEVLLGAKEIVVNSQTSSAEVEFQSLYHGLKKLAYILQDYESACLTVTVNGDCKNVINQMNGLARPRKLEKYYTECKNLIKQQMSTHRFIFRHVPRSQNVVCDRLASFAVIAQEYRAERLLFEDIYTLSKKCVPSMEKNLETINLNDEVVQILKNHFASCSLIPYSVRHLIYKYLLFLCTLIRDYETMFLVSERFQQDFESLETNMDDSTCSTKLKWNDNHMKEEIASYHLAACDGVGKYDSKFLYKLKRNKNLNWEIIKNMSLALIELPYRNGDSMDLILPYPKIETLHQKLASKFQKISPAFLQCIENIDECIDLERKINFWQITSCKNI